MSTKALIAFEVAASFRKLRPAQGAADPSLQRDLNCVATQIDRPVVPPGAQKFRSSPESVRTPVGMRGAEREARPGGVAVGGTGGVVTQILGDSCQDRPDPRDPGTGPIEAGWPGGSADDRRR